MQGNVWNIFDHDNTMAKTARFYYELISITTLVDVRVKYVIFNIVLRVARTDSGHFIHRDSDLHND